MLTADQLRKVGNFDQDTINALSRQLGTAETLAVAGACSLNTYESILTVSGTMAFTLAAPTVEGQRKRIACGSAASTPAATLTVSSPDDTAGFVLSSTFYFDTAGQAIELVATAALKWRATRIQRAGGTANNVVVGTTVLTGKNLWQLYALSVTGTVVSTIAAGRGIPNGNCVGERIVIGNSTAASTPIGSIGIAARSIVGGAVVDLQAIGATTDTAVCEWDGTAWQILYTTGITLA